MKWEDLTPGQVQALKEQIDRQGICFYRLLKRLEVLGFPPADPLYSHVYHAAGGIEALRALLRDYGKPRASPPTTAPQRPLARRRRQVEVLRMIANDHEANALTTSAGLPNRSAMNVGLSHVHRGTHRCATFSKGVNSLRREIIRTRFWYHMRILFSNVARRSATRPAPKLDVR